MVTVRTAKSKGSQFEYDCVASLAQTGNYVYRTAELGFQRQYDIEIKDTTPEHNTLAIIECKRLKGISWNELDKLYRKLHLKLKNPMDHEGKCYLLFQSNHQPCLVYAYIKGEPCIKLFENVFLVPFIKHKSTRATKEVK